MNKGSLFRTPFDSQCVSGSQTFPKFRRQHFYPIFSSIWDKLSWETSLLVRSEILQLFVNILTADCKYSRHNWEDYHNKLKCKFKTNSNLNNDKIFTEILLRFLNFETYWKKHEPHSLSICKVIDSDKYFYLNG